MTVEEIMALKVPAASQSHLWLWAVSKKVDWAYLVAEAWGFKPITLLTWAKSGLGLGRFQTNTEHILLARRGPAAGNAFLPTKGTWFNWPKRRCVEKPDEFYQLVERVSQGPYLDMFARKERSGWAVWGNEVQCDIEIASAYKG
jgi:N6-adenosine-specific RNA methylase IME4